MEPSSGQVKLERLHGIPDEVKDSKETEGQLKLVRLDGVPEEEEYLTRISDKACVDVAIAEDELGFKVNKLGYYKHRFSKKLMKKKSLGNKNKETVGESFHCTKFDHQAVEEPSLLNHKTEKLLICNECNYQCGEKSRLREHMRIHNDQKQLNALSKKDRGCNFSREEVEILIELVEKYKSVLESKGSGVVCWRKKQDKWRKLSIEFNCKSGKVYRSTKTLYEKYNRLKKMTRKKLAMGRRQMCKTGGGPSVDFSPAEEKIKSMFLLSAEGHQNNVDSDRIKEAPWNGWKPSQLQSEVKPVLEHVVIDKVELVEDQMEKCPSPEKEIVLIESSSPKDSASRNACNRERRINCSPIAQRRISTTKARSKKSTLAIFASKKQQLIELQIEELKFKAKMRDVEMSILKEKEKQSKIKTKLMEMNLCEKERSSNKLIN